jgi:hypothetical protein
MSKAEIREALTAQTMGAIHAYLREVNAEKVAESAQKEMQECIKKRDEFEKKLKG